MAEKSRETADSHISDVRPEYVLLGLLKLKPMHGYDLYQELQSVLGRVWRMSQSQMYSILKRMEAQGLLQGTVPAEGSSKRLLTLTPLGSEKFETWLRTPSDCGSRILRPEFISRLYFAVGIDVGLAIRLAEEQASLVERHLANHSRLLGSADAASPYNRLGLQFKVYQLKAEADWIRETALPFLAGL